MFYKKLANTAEKQIGQILTKLEKKKIKKTKKKIKKTNYWRKRNFSDGCIDWRMSAISIYNMIRALDKPYIGSYFFFKKRKITVWKSKIIRFNLKNIEWYHTNMRYIYYHYIRK